MLQFLKQSYNLYSHHTQELNKPRHPFGKNYHVIKLQINQTDFHKSLSHSLAKLEWDAEFGRRDTTDHKSDPVYQL